MSLAPSSAIPPRVDPLPIGCGQAVLGLIVGVATLFVLHGADPLGVTAFALPQGIDPAEQMAAFARWRGSARVVIGSLVMAWLPLLAAGLCGVFAHRSRPSSVPAAVLRTVGVATLLLLVSEVGSRAIDRALSTGESSDIGTPLAMLAFESLCIAMAAPLASSATRRRPRDAGQVPRDLARRDVEDSA